jgi:enamine deaminase RidA (YjgF/YER057c/UK114 family)
VTVTAGTRRTVAGTIDAEHAYGSTVAAGGGFVFFSATAVDDSGRLAASARPAPPYAGSAAAQAQAQARTIFSRLDELLPQVGSSVGDIVQIEQYVRLKLHADSYFKIATSKTYLGRAVPVAATAQVGEYDPADSVVSVTGLAIVPDADAGFVKAEPEDPTGAAAANRKFSELITAGPYGFTTIFPSDRKSGLPEAARTPAWIWSGSEIGAEVKWGLEELASRLATVGSTLEDIVDYTLFLTDSGDLFEFDQALRAVAGSAAPTRTIIPSRGYALPRREDAFGHDEGAPRMEAQFRFQRPDGGAEKATVDGPGAGFGYQSAGMRLGPLVWTSSLVASPDHLGGAAESQLQDILAALQATLENGGSTLSETLRLRVLLRNRDDVAAVNAAIRRAIPSDPPAVSIVVVPTALPVAEASMAIDAVGLVGD